jgi:hypothetical protein
MLVTHSRTRVLVVFAKRMAAPWVWLTLVDADRFAPLVVAQVVMGSTFTILDLFAKRAELIPGLLADFKGALHAAMLAHPGAAGMQRSALQLLTSVSKGPSVRKAHAKEFEGWLGVGRGYHLPLRI